MVILNAFMCLASDERRDARCVSPELLPRKYPQIVILDRSQIPNTTT